MKILPVTMSVVFVASFTHGAVAKDPLASKDPRNRSISLALGIPDAIRFHGYLGLAVGAFPDYAGSDDVAAVAAPLLDIRQDDFLFVRGASVNPSEGGGSIGWNALNFGYSASGQRLFTLSVGPLIRFMPGRDESDNPALGGLGDIDASVGAGGFIEARSGAWFADVSVIPQDAGEAGNGLLVSLRSGFDMALSERMTGTWSFFTSWGDDDYMQGYYGVNADQSARSGLPSFAASSGFKDIGVSMSMYTSISDSLLLHGQIGYQRLLGGAVDSPIIDLGNGTRDQFRALFGVVYRF